MDMSTILDYQQSLSRYFDIRGVSCESRAVQIMCKTCTNMPCAIFVQLAVRTVKIPLGGHLYSRKTVF